ncbi:MAG: PduL/EutD family phosphate acyltransferase, partial [Sweet potato little leaf phytoplasma]|nr:PduL/EutD family phosphate acyltransferase [Sweet potato little leaf phytoplasma]
METAKLNISFFHFHLCPCIRFKIISSDKQVVSVRVGGIKAGILQNVLCRVNKDFSLELHIDTD